MPARKALGVMAVMAAMTLAPRDTLAQTATFAGRVTSAAGTPLGGANVGIPDAGIGAITDSAGRYSFNVAVDRTAGRNVMIVARYIGYKPQRLPVTLTPGRSDHDFTLERDVLHLEAVIVTGTSAATSQRMTPFSVSVIDDVQIREVPSASPLGTLAGRIAGASFVTPSGQPGSTPRIRLRAATSIVASADPMVIIDGTITRLSLADINSEDIERVEIIKGAAASSLYGSDAANGVVQIFTKRNAHLADGQTT